MLMISRRTLVTLVVSQAAFLAIYHYKWPNKNMDKKSYFTISKDVAHGRGCHTGRGRGGAAREKGTGVQGIQTAELPGRGGEDMNLKQIKRPCCGNIIASASMRVTQWNR